MSILYFTIIAFYFAIKSGWKISGMFSSYSSLQCWDVGGERRPDGKAGWLGGAGDNCCHILVFRWWVSVPGSSRQLIGWYWQVSYHSGTWCNVLTRRSLTLVSASSSYTPCYAGTVRLSPRHQLPLTCIIVINTHLGMQPGLETKAELRKAKPSYVDSWDSAVITIQPPTDYKAADFTTLTCHFHIIFCLYHPPPPPTITGQNLLSHHQVD